MNIIEDKAKELQDRIFEVVRQEEPDIVCTVLIKMLTVGTQVNKIKKEDFMKELSNCWDFYEKVYKE